MASSLPVSLHLKAASSQEAGAAPVEALHLLPFNIQYSGPANVKAYFDPQEVSSSYTGEDGAYKAYFRGRALLGTRIALPAGYIGQIWKSNGPSISRVAVDERRKRERVAVAATNDIEYSQDSPRRSPRKHGIPADGAEKQVSANKKQKLDAQQNKKKKKKLVKREMFDLDDGDTAEGSSNSNNPGLEAAVDLEDVVVTGMDVSDQQAGGQLKSEDVDMQDEVNLSQEPQTEMGQEPLAEETREVTAAPTAFKVESVPDPIVSQTSPVKAEPPAPIPREATPPPHSSSAIPSSSMPGTPSTPHASAQMPIINIATPKPFSRAMEDDGAGEQGEEAITERILEDIARFEHVTVWNPDIALDKGEDVYVRALDEWTKLAEFIHGR